MTPRYPDITFQLSGMDGDAHHILVQAINAMKQAGLPEAEIETFLEEAMTDGDYNHVIQTCRKYFTVV